MFTTMIRTWLRDKALPLWAELGIDSRFGGPIEALELSGLRPLNTPFKRTRVAGRQLYVFSHAALLGWKPGVTIAHHLFEHMQKKYWINAKAGWARRISPSGEILDPTPDLYDYAFVLFGMAWYYRLTANQEVLASAHRTLDILHAHFKHPIAGYLHEIPAHLPRQQNPHMHLLEAALAWVEAASCARFAALAAGLRGLFKDHMFHAESGVLPEYFEEDLRPFSGPQGRWIEPGHQLEWAWILAEDQRLSKVDNSHHIRALMTFAEAHGIDQKTGLTINAVRDDGLILDAGSRTWPTTERIKGQIAMQELFGIDARPAVEASCQALFRHHLSHPVGGCWFDSFDATGQAQIDFIPASTFYHLFLAFSEVLRVFEVETQKEMLSAS